METSKRDIGRQEKKCFFSGGKIDKCKKAGEVKKIRASIQNAFMKSWPF